MKCPNCGHQDSSVLKTETIEAGAGGIVKRRRRKCLCGIKTNICEQTFLTFEVSQEDFNLLQEAKAKRTEFQARDLVPSQLSESAGIKRLTIRPRKSGR